MIRQFLLSWCARYLAKHGAQTRRSRERAAYLAFHRDMNVAMGRDIPEALL